MKGGILAPVNIAGYRTVYTDYNEAGSKFFTITTPCRSMMHQVGQFRRKYVNLGYPLVSHGSGNDNETGRMLLLYLVGQKTQYLEGFSQSHVICQAPSKLVFV